MIRAAVVEDDPKAQQELIGYLRRYEKESGEVFHTSVFSDGVEITRDYKPVYDLILMDIELGRMSGMEAAEQIRTIDRDVVIIFITNSPQYAIRGYEVEALDYCLKPISYYAFSQKIARALERMERRRQRSIGVSTGHGNIRRIPLSDIGYIEVREHSLIYHTRQGTLTAGGKLGELEEQLSGRGFFRCNKGYLVNLELVEGLSGEDCIVLGDVVQVSRAKKKPFLDALNNYINEVGK